MKLWSLRAVFEQRLLRIPDYQRGYAWEERHIEDFWGDIIRLNENALHYTGVVTLKRVEKTIYDEWKEDKWMIDMEFEPFYIVDGHQRLATSMILMQAIIERIESEEKITGKEIYLNHQSIDDIRGRYILNKATNGLSESFLFGYEKGNPSDEFLKTHIFAPPSSDSHQETLYTQNLLKAKEYFKDKLSKMEVEEPEPTTDHKPTIKSIFKKLTLKLKFNLYEIDNEIDVFVAFETMNNRGKLLTNLELLKNRLIYLSTLSSDNGKEILRDKINNAWKTIYEYLGKNPEKLLPDDEFLRNHWIMYFEYDSHKNYRNFLLNEKFTTQKIANKEIDNTTIKEYVISLERSVKHWFYIHNPSHPDFSKFSDEEDKKNKELLDRLQRLGFSPFKPLLLASYVSNKNKKDINLLLVAMERYNFTIFELSQRRSNTGESVFFGHANKILKDNAKGDMPISTARCDINKWVDDYYYSSNNFNEYIQLEYTRGRKNGFYSWGGLQYFLYEYDRWLCDKGRQLTEKLEWGDFLKRRKEQKDHVTIEHIFPQNASDPYWEKHFGKFKEDQKKYLTHSLGNLLLLSRSKNSKLQNNDFHKKKNNKQGIGYYNGSCSENEVNTHEDWTPDQILQRGLEMLEFMEERWEIKLGDEEFKRKLLHLDFLSEDQQN